MNDRDSRNFGSTAAIIAVVVALMLAVSCLVAVVLFGAGIFVYRTTEQYETEVEQLLNESPPAPAGSREKSGNTRGQGDILLICTSQRNSRLSPFYSE